MSRKHYIALGLALVAISLIGASQWLSSKIQPLAVTPAIQPIPTLGQWLRVSGAATVLRPPSFDEIPLDTNGPLIQGEEVRTGSGEVEFRLNNGFELQVAAQSRFFVDSWNRELPGSPLLISIVTGSFKTLKAGYPTDLFVLQNGQLLDPLHPVVKERHPLVISGAPQDFSLVGPSPRVGPSTAHSTAPGSTAAANTLSDEYMDSVLGAQKVKFARCQANALREQKVAQGDMVVGFKINNDGRTSEVRILNSTMTDSSFQTCILEVITTLKFQAFPGAPITRSFDLKFD
jgi:TonB family protein